MNSQKPAHELRIGLNRAAIWKNSGEGNRTWYSVALSRSYKVGEEWKSTNSFNWSDLLEVGKLADLAHSWIFDQQSANQEDASETLNDESSNRPIPNPKPPVPNRPPTVARR